MAVRLLKFQHALWRRPISVRFRIIHGARDTFYLKFFIFFYSQLSSLEISFQLIFHCEQHEWGEGSENIKMNLGTRAMLMKSLSELKTETLYGESYRWNGMEVLDIVLLAGWNPSIHPDRQPASQPASRSTRHPSIVSINLSMIIRRLFIIVEWYNPAVSIDQFGIHKFSGPEPRSFVPSKSERSESELRPSIGGVYISLTLTDCWPRSEIGLCHIMLQQLQQQPECCTNCLLPAAVAAVAVADAVLK